MILFSWTAMSGSTSDPLVGLGITDNLERAKQAAEECLLAGRAALAVIESVRPVMAAHGLSPCYLRTGAVWLGGRDARGGVSWRRSFLRGDGADRIGP